MVRNRFSTVLGEKRVRIAAISRDTGISRTTLTNLYYDRNCVITFSVIGKLCDYLHCGITDIIEYTQEGA